MSFTRRCIGLTTGILVAGAVIFSSPVFSQEKKEIVFLSQEEDPVSISAYKELVKKFESENPNIKIKYVIAGATEVIARAATAVPAGKVDVVQPHPTMALELAHHGLLLKLNDIVERFGGEETFPHLSLLKLEGNVYGVPFAGGARTLWYRKDLFKKYGILAPETWNELVTATNKLCLDTDGDGEKDLYGIAIPAGTNPSTHTWFQHFLFQGGSELLNKDLEVVFDNPRSVETMKFYTDLCKNAPPGVMSYSWFEPLQIFLARKAAVTCRGGRMFGQVYEQAPDLVGKIDTLPFLKGHMRAIMTDYSIYSIASNTKHPSIAKKWTEFLLKGENNVKILLTVPGHLYPTTPAQERELFSSGNPIVEADDFAHIMWKNFIAVDKYGQSKMLNVGGIDWKNRKIDTTGIANPYLSPIEGKNIIPKAVQQVLLGKSTPEEAVEWAAAEMKKVVAEAQKSRK